MCTVPLPAPCRPPQREHVPLTAGQYGQDGSADPKVGQLLKAAVKHGSGVLAPPRSRRAEAWTHVRELQKGECERGDWVRRATETLAPIQADAEGPRTADRRYDHSYLTLHYGWALGRVFEAWRGHDAVVVVEDDMTFSPDFLLYFQATVALPAHPPSAASV